MGAGPTRALTGGRRTKPTSTGCRRLRQPEPGRRSTYQAGEPVQTNRASSVLGYSFVSGGLEAIGVWHNSTFKTYFVEGTTEFPTVSNNLLWNEPGLIVITGANNDPNSYIVPRPGIRLSLADWRRAYQQHSQL